MQDDQSVDSHLITFWVFFNLSPSNWAYFSISPSNLDIFKLLPHLYNLRQISSSN